MNFPLCTFLELLAHFRKGACAKLCYKYQGRYKVIIVDTLHFKDSCVTYIKIDIVGFNFLPNENLSILTRHSDKLLKIFAHIDLQ